jgi:hypothetical protein
MASIQQQILAADPEADVSSALGHIGPDIESTFVWEGLGWKPGLVLERLRWLGLALLLALAATIPFDRFDPARRRPGPQPTAVDAGQESAPTAPTPRARTPRLAPFSSAARRWRFSGVLAAELRLMLKGRGWLWYLGAIGLNLACVLNPSTAVQRYLLLAVWVWPLTIWSKMGARERRFNTEQLVFCAPRPAVRQLPATWLAGVVVTIVAGSGAWLYLILAGDTASLMGWFTGALFVPALALALGAWTGSSRAFEAGYLFLWYLGPFEGILALDYTGASAGGEGIGMPLVYLALTTILVVLAMLGRWHRARG